MIYQTIPAKLNVMSKDAQMSFNFIDEEGFYNFAATQLSIQNQHLLTVHTYDGVSHIVKRNHPLPVGAANRGSLFFLGDGFCVLQSNKSSISKTLLELIGLPDAALSLLEVTD